MVPTSYSVPMSESLSEPLRRCGKCGARAVEQLLSVENRIEDERLGRPVVYRTGTTEYWKCDTCGHRFSLLGTSRLALFSVVALGGIAVALVGGASSPLFWVLGGGVALSSSVVVLLTVARRLRNPLGPSDPMAR